MHKRSDYYSLCKMKPRNLLLKLHLLNVKPCSLAYSQDVAAGLAVFLFSYRQQVPQRGCYPSTRLHGITSWKTMIFTTMKKQNYTK